MKVLFLQHGLGYGGATKSLLLMQKSLKDDIECYTIISKTKRINQDIKKEFIHTKEFVTMNIPSIYSYAEGIIDKNRFYKNRAFFPIELIDYINGENIDIIHINSTVFSNVVKPIKENTSCKIVVHLREMLPFGASNLVDAFIIENYINYADAIISISDNECKYFSKFENLFIIPNPYDFEAVEPNLNMGLFNKGTLTIGMCANFVPIKGHLYFLEVAKLINEKMINSKVTIEFCIIGYPHKIRSVKEIVKRVISYGYKSQFDKKVKNYKIHNIRIIPFTFNVYSELVNFDIYVRPDISGNPWGRDIIEAMALRIPIIATGESEYFIKNGLTGYLVPPKDTHKMAEKIIELINDKNRRENMGKAGFNFVNKNCNMESYKNKILDVYKSINNGTK